MVLGVNLAANTVFSLWSAAASFLAVPILVRHLGVEAYALIGLYLSAQSLLLVLDLGIAPAANRQVARNIANGNPSENADLLATLSPLYWGIAVLLALITVPFAKFIVTYWLNSRDGNIVTERSLFLIGLIIAARWPATLYQSTLMGAQKIALTSSIGIGMVTLATGGGLITVIALNPNIEAYFLWQLVCALVFTQVLRRNAWKVIGGRKVAVKDFKLVKNIWRFSAGMAGVSLTAVLIQQLDKILLSKWLSIGDLGNYMVAGALASGLYIILTPVFNSVYPRFSTHIANEALDLLYNEYRVATRALCAVVFPVAFSGAYFAEDILKLWLGEENFNPSTSPVLGMLILGTAMNGIMHLPYALQLAARRSRLPLTINLFLISLYVPLGYFLTQKFGLLGGSAASLVQNILYLVAGSYVTHTLLLRDIRYKWLLADILPTVIVCAASLGLVKLIMIGTGVDALGSVLIAGSFAAPLMAICLLLFLPAQSRIFFSRAMREIFGIEANQ